MKVEGVICVQAVVQFLTLPVDQSDQLQSFHLGKSPSVHTRQDSGQIRSWSVCSGIKNRALYTCPALLHCVLPTVALDKSAMLCCCFGLFRNKICKQTHHCMDLHPGYGWILFHKDSASAMMCNIVVHCLAHHTFL